MSSPYRPSDRTLSSPSRHRLNGSASRRETQTDAQSTHLIEELSRLLIEDDRTFNRKLDEEALLQQKRHVEALEKALAQHESIRRSAEQTYEAIQLDLERQRIAREADQRRQLEEQRRKLAEEQAAEQKRLEEERIQEVVRKEKADQLERERRAAAEREVERKRREKEEAESESRATAARNQVEVERKTRDDAAQRQLLLQQEQPQAAHTQSNGAPSTNATPSAIPTANTPKETASTSDSRARIHEAYLRIHARLKALRKEIVQLKNSDRGAYDTIREHERNVKTVVGQLVKNDNVANKSKVLTIRQHWEWAVSYLPQFTADINEFRVEGKEPFSVSKVFLYTVNCTSKHIIKQMMMEASIDPSSADPLGILTAQLFSSPSCKPQGIAMVDVFWAKFHKANPVLFGITGSLKSSQDRARLGWNPDWSKEEALDRFRGSARGFAAITLRDFSKSQNANPFPNRFFYETLARAVNTPTAKQNAIHYLNLQGMLDPIFVPRFIQFYGAVAIASLRFAILTFPESRDKQNGTIKEVATGVSNLYFKYESDLNLHL